ncbi:hypothetical protein E2L08_03740 [Palleronia sediminis]|uniref:Uncharacterized protein n=1 Tax=Palleronia sediminis TaxID=2547833 RepID=A0A4R6AH49_9RHOB|nr:hypothetical protein [Palleronia sediminis]TDL81778.1 hypothetical protein E2L08_03740 [Palleronia sediminis]
MQTFANLDAFAAARPALKGPIAIIFAEDDAALDATLAHHAAKGFATILLMAGPAIAPTAPPPACVTRIGWTQVAPNAVIDAVNRVIELAPHQWIYYGFNAEFLFYPFAETRSVAELVAFHMEERREAMLTYVIDLYAVDLTAHPDGVGLADAHLDRAGYFALARPDPAEPAQPLERQLNFYGGLRWRFEEHVPKDRRRIDRIALFRARPGLTLREGYLMSDEEMNTYACPWHHNLTAAVCSFRAAKALRTNAGSRYSIESFHWFNSVRFDWSSEQLLNLGLIEPGQWF